MDNLKVKLNDYFSDIINQIDIQAEKLLLKLTKQEHEKEKQDLNLDRKTLIDKVNNLKEICEQDLENDNHNVKCFENKFCYYIPNRSGMAINVSQNKSLCDDTECLFNNKVGKLVILNQAIDEGNLNELKNFINAKPRFLGPDNRNIKSFQDLLVISTIFGLLKNQTNQILVDLSLIEENKLEKLNVYSNMFQDLNGTDFDILKKYIPVESIKALQLYHSLATSIPKSVFEIMSKLTQLDIECLSIEKLYDNTFSCLTDLQKLNLSLPSLTSIEKNTFHDLLNLKVLSLTGSRLSQIPLGTFDNLTNLEDLYLSFNKLDIIYADLFFPLKNLISLTLRKNCITRIEKGAFNGLHKLKSLDLNNNRIDIIDAQLFEQCFDLEVLDLGNNVIKTIQPGTLSANLKYLCLRNNLIVKLDFLNGLNKLEFLDLFGAHRYYKQKLMDIKIEEYEHMRVPNLKMLQLYSDIMPIFSEYNFQNLQALEVFGLDDLSVGSLESIKSLEYLKIECNKNLNENVFKGLKNLKYLGLIVYRRDERYLEMKDELIKLFDDAKENLVVETLSERGDKVTIEFRKCSSATAFFQNSLNVSESIKHHIAVSNYLKRLNYVD